VLRPLATAGKLGRPWGGTTRLLALILLLVISAASTAHAEKRVALVIGNAAYQNVTPLLNTRNDADEIAASLNG
jgi:hypothetical protein